MNRRCTALLSVAMSCLFASFALAQATSISAPTASYGNNLPSTYIPSSASTGFVVHRRVANSDPIAKVNAQNRMAQPTPLAWRQEMPFGRLVELMINSGLDVYVDESLADNNLGRQQLVRLALHSADLKTNLNFALAAYDCTYQINDAGIISLMSEDAAFENQVSTTYDLRLLVTDTVGAYEVENLLMETVDPDSWEANGGAARARTVKIGTRYSLTIVQTYQNQLKIQSLLDKIYSIGDGAVQGIASAYSSSVYDDRETFQASSGSTPVLLPEQYTRLRENRRGMSLPGSGSTSGFGGGGFGGGAGGLGGGVF